jgi:hypothetical protein
MNLTGKINLASLEGTAFTKGKNGQYLFDIEKANLYHSEKGALYLDIISYENKDKKYNDFSVKQSLPKEIREREKAENKQRPFLGNQSYMKQQEESFAPIIQNEDVFTEESDLPY